MTCLNCGIGEAIKDPNLGYLPCKSCTDKGRQYTAKKEIHEFVSEDIKLDRIKHRDLTIQPFRGGRLSREYVEKYGTKGLEVTDREVKQAENVWGDLTYYD